MKKRILIGTLGVLVLAVLAIGAPAWRLVGPTKGRPIDGNAKGTALLVVDVQEDFTGAHAKKPFREAARLIATVNRLIHASSERGWSVVFVRMEVPDKWLHRLLSGGTAMRGTPGVRVDSRLERPPSSVELSKEQGDAFANEELGQYLQAHGIGKLIVTGLDANYCVNATVGGARNRGYDTTVVEDGIATESGKSLLKILEEYRKVGASVKNSGQLLTETLRPAAP